MNSLDLIDEGLPQADAEQARITASPVQVDDILVIGSHQGRNLFGPIQPISIIRPRVPRPSNVAAPSPVQAPRSGPVAASRLISLNADHPCPQAQQANGPTPLPWAALVALGRGQDPCRSEFSPLLDDTTKWTSAGGTEAPPAFPAPFIP